MPWTLLGLRSFALLTHGVWVGGFTFYGAVVLWVVHDEFGSIEAGGITRRVTDWLNVIGVATVLLWWLLAWAERRSGHWLRSTLLGATSVLLAFLIYDHGVLDRSLDERGLTGFYALHRVYLIASTAQWAINLLLVPATLWIWRIAPGRPQG